MGGESWTGCDLKRKQGQKKTEGFGGRLCCNHGNQPRLLTCLGVFPASYGYDSFLPLISNSPSSAIFRVVASVLVFSSLKRGAKEESLLCCAPSPVWGLLVGIHAHRKPPLGESRRHGSCCLRHLSRKSQYFMLCVQELDTFHSKS